MKTIAFSSFSISNECYRHRFKCNDSSDNCPFFFFQKLIRIHWLTFDIFLFSKSTWMTLSLLRNQNAVHDPTKEKFEDPKRVV